jgi:hypothetical protein
MEERAMIAEAFENYARLNGAWLQAWSDANAASITGARVAFGQLELAALTSRFMTQRVRAYADYDGRIEPLVRRLDQLTEQYGEDYARELREIYSAWSDLLRQDRTASQTLPLARRGEQRRDESWDGRGDAERAERRPEAAAH